MPQLSATTLKLFQECPRCFWWHVNHRVERPRGPFPSLPGGIDRVLKEYFDTYRQKGTLPPLIQGKFKGRLANQALTIGFTDPTTKTRLWGKLDDCVMLPNQQLVPLDHKTRASAPDGPGYTKKYYQLQMDVYTLLLERDGNPTGRVAYVVYYFPTPGVLHDGFPFGVAVHEIATHPDTAYELFVAACRCLAGPMPEIGAQCGFCHWAAVRKQREAALKPVRKAASASRRAVPVPDDLFA